MAIDQAKLEMLLRRFQALHQRQEPLRQLLQLLAGEAAWRSVDGSLALPLSDTDKQEIKGWLRDYLDESQAIIDSIRTEIA